ncbi:AtpZ/AtpI family protein [Ancylomarina longa]|nr:AtpZ/AtpI family protein [Ancylomarina longa]
MSKKNKDTENSFSKKKKQLDGVLRYSGLAFQMMAIILVVLYAGIKLDQYLGNEFPLFTIIGAIGGVFLSLYFALRDLLKPNK